jgi:hypothetical protein
METRHGTKGKSLMAHQIGEGIGPMPRAMREYFNPLWCRFRHHSFVLRVKFKIGTGSPGPPGGIHRQQVLEIDHECCLVICVLGRDADAVVSAGGGGNEKNFPLR